MAGIRPPPQLKAPSFRALGGGGALAGITHYAEKPLHLPQVTAPKIPKPSVPRIAQPKVTAPKFTSAGGLGQPGFGAAGPIATNRPPRTKQITPRITPM